jgi:hypothetical protein
MTLLDFLTGVLAVLTLAAAVACGAPRDWRRADLGTLVDITDRRTVGVVAGVAAVIVVTALPAAGWAVANVVLAIAATAWGANRFRRTHGSQRPAVFLGANPGNALDAAGLVDATDRLPALPTCDRVSTHELGRVAELSDDAGMRALELAGRLAVRTAFHGDRVIMHRDDEELGVALRTIAATPLTVIQEARAAVLRRAERAARTAEALRRGGRGEHTLEVVAQLLVARREGSEALIAAVKAGGGGEAEAHELLEPARWNVTLASAARYGAAVSEALQYLDAIVQAVPDAVPAHEQSRLGLAEVRAELAHLGAEVGDDEWVTCSEAVVLTFAVLESGYPGDYLPASEVVSDTLRSLAEDAPPKRAQLLCSVADALDAAIDTRRADVEVGR